ncbi:hypothetical protein [Pseudonocardia acaciae]|uniref:hypothetical protein n=1 Tax=Pseudonocardia acaciae TaxID=551276 RepID=UPI0012ED7157|nr:hypothetical protein [Pseudonocardia acaciae]
MSNLENLKNPNEKKRSGWKPEKRPGGSGENPDIHGIADEFRTLKEISETIGLRTEDEVAVASFNDTLCDLRSQLQRAILSEAEQEVINCKLNEEITKLCTRVAELEQPRAKRRLVGASKTAAQAGAGTAIAAWVLGDEVPKAVLRTLLAATTGFGVVLLVEAGYHLVKRLVVGESTTGKHERSNLPAHRHRLSP